ncbi:MAG: hydrogenase [Thermoproteota archaeon]|nr:MAG: hydrogenase [Candidatus Korarchaeota archaeon]
MMYLKLPREDFDAFFKNLQEYGKIYGPVKTGSSAYNFKEVTTLDEMDLSYNRTIVPPKKFFVGLKEKIFEFDEKRAEFREVIEDDPRKVIFGIHSCDIHALKLLDKIYLEDMADKYYLERRRNAILIGIDCHPDEHCFCKSMGTSYATDGFDLFLHEISDGFFVRVGSMRGHEIVAKNKGLFDPVGSEDIEEFKRSQKKRLDEFKLELNFLGLQDMLELAHNSQIWDEYAEKCLGCGTCNLVCPTCRCYDVIDFVNLDITTGERVRRWDSCMLRRHGLVAGGLNFRPTRVERLRNRFNCKGSLLEGMPNCVGCGRCTVYCPAGIDYVEVLRKIAGD